MDIEKEIELLREKVKLLEKIKELQEAIKLNEQPQQPVYVPFPVWPQPYQSPWTYPCYDTSGTFFDHSFQQ